ncbi:competence type IV pilus ATPase ComGA [Bacillus coahuilensis]|uniref:competence type IV pilus ATPase ComGA n=1 Tax=Bacillus coahuilensis TaxID=408580 RepID=UPI000185073E|nr:competence type IV pilus ATPase ComGA [Bacillus coahuilensis]
MSIQTKAVSIIEAAIRCGVSDIHFLPRKNEYIIQFRAAGMLSHFTSIHAKEGERMIAHFKYDASMDIAEKRKPQSGSLHLTFNHQSYSLRFSTLPSSYQRESLVIRILPQHSFQPIQHQLLFPTMAKQLVSLLKNPHGLLLYSGPTGSGKTTLLYTLVQYCSDQLHRHVITLEDPIEKINEDFLQIQVNERAGMTYSNGLKAILRHDPDVIMVGEIRDEETAHIAVRAALSGHLVLSTIHSRNAVGAVHRLLEFGVNKEEVIQTVVGITAQRLVRLRCPLCGEEEKLHCLHLFHNRRASVMEILMGSALLDVLNNGSPVLSRKKFISLDESLRKGVALGYITEREYSKWAIQTEIYD